MSHARPVRRVVARARDLTKEYSVGGAAVPVLHGISLTISTGSLTLLMGPSGSGKTTLVSLLAGLLRPTAGQVELCGVPISRLSDAEVAAARRAHLGFIFQSYNLFAALSALDNVALALRMKGLAWPAARRRAGAALERVGLGARLGHRPPQLSGGERQRVAIARAVVGEPALVIGDEITAALDGPSAFQVMELLRAHLTDATAVLLVTHDLRLERFAHRVIQMSDGRLRDDRPPLDAAPLEVAG